MSTVVKTIKSQREIGSQALLDATWTAHKRTRDRRGPMPLGLRAARVCQFLNYRCMAEYDVARRRIQTARHGEAPRGFAVCAAHCIES